ncbi:MAG: hypothetical protein Q8Q58_05470 [Candidatus Rokubacteria bacterium]|nr:hypothetical protein [Candidatus Rokubacteria bacterium]
MRDHVAEAGGATEPRREGVVDDSCPGQSTEGIGITGGRTEVEVEAGRQRQVDHHLHGLPEVKDHDVRDIRRRPERSGIGRKPFGHTGQVTTDDHRPLREEVAVEGAHRVRLARTPA